MEWLSIVVAICMKTPDPAACEVKTKACVEWVYEQKDIVGDADKLAIAIFLQDPKNRQKVCK